MRPDICGFCGQPGADKVPHPVRWPGEESAGTEFVHAACESAECGRAHGLLSDKQREAFLRRSSQCIMANLSVETMVARAYVQGMNDAIDSLSRATEHHD